MPPRPSSGSTATTSSMIPKPPTNCKKQRHTLTETGRLSSPLNTVEPVAVSPLMASKYASVKLRPSIASNSGTAANTGNTDQTRLASKKPSRGCNSRLL